MKTVTLYIDVDFDETKTDAEGVAVAIDAILTNALATPGILDNCGNPQVGTIYVQEPDKPETCVFCDKPLPADFEQVADEGWHPDYWEGERHCDGPVCPECLERYCKLDESGEFVLKELKGEFVSRRRSGQEFRIACIAYPKNRMVKVLETREADEGDLEEEYVVLDGKRYEAASIGERCTYTVVQQKTMFFYK